MNKKCKAIVVKPIFNRKFKLRALMSLTKESASTVSNSILEIQNKNEYRQLIFSCSQVQEEKISRVRCYGQVK